MGIVSGIVTYLIIWWVVLFVVLPIGIETSSKREHPSHASSAPVYFSWKRKALYTTIAATIIFILFCIFKEKLSEIIFAKDGFFAMGPDLDFS